MNEIIWKPIKGFEGLYEVSTTGLIKSCARNIQCKDGKIKHLKERILKPSLGTYGRNQYSLCKEGRKYSVRGYRIVAETFLLNPNNLPEVNHIDGNNLNDNINNLEWVSNEENIQHGITNNLFNTFSHRKIIKKIN